MARHWATGCNQLYGQRRKPVPFTEDAARVPKPPAYLRDIDALLVRQKDRLEDPSMKD
jgi:hypothetical protein